MGVQMLTASTPTTQQPSLQLPQQQQLQQQQQQAVFGAVLPRTIMDEHMVRYANVIMKASSASSSAQTTPSPALYRSILDEFADISNYVKDGVDLRDVWLLLRDMVSASSSAAGPSGNPPASVGSFQASYLSGDPALVGMLVDGALRFLQSQYSTLLEVTIGRQPELARRGGAPSLVNTVRAYLNIVLARPESKEKLEITKDGTPIWALLYYCVRCGGLQEALEIAAKVRDRIGSFYVYFREYVTNKRRLPQQQWEKMCAEFNSEIRTHTLDPFKLTLWNVISRCDITEFRPFRDVITSTQDFIWYKMMLCSWDAVPDVMKAQDLRLKQIQQQLLNLGSNHFNPLGRTPFIYLFVLLSAQLFEEGIAFVLTSTPYQIEAIHMAVALYHYGLLRVPTSDNVAAEGGMELVPVEMLLYDAEGRPTLNLPRILRDYAARLVVTNPVEALQYAAILRDEPMASLCIADLVTISGEFDMLLGTLASDNSVQVWTLQ